MEETTQTIQVEQKPQGVEATKYNALKHGVLRETLTDYEQFDLDTFFDQLKAEYSPKNMLEELALERIAVAQIKLHRIARAEAEFMKETMEPNILFGNEEILSTVGYPILLTPQRMEKLANLYSRYETSAENRFYRAIRQFLEIRKMKYE